jgi:aminopeptidase N
VYGYVFSPYLIPGKAAFETTKQALALYTDLYGPYDQSSLSMVQADFNHGMEYEGLYFQSKGFFDLYAGSVESYLITIAAHETAHQWWYGQVANDQALEPWLDEALCTFSELLFFEQLFPESVDWWWAVRVNHYQPSGSINRSIYGFREYTDQYLAYRNATYLQGAKFMNTLRSLMGDEQFFEFIQEYALDQTDQIATKADFFSTLGRYINLDNQDWMTEYFPPEG